MTQDAHSVSSLKIGFRPLVVARRCGRDAEIGDVKGVVPIELVDLRQGNSPAFEMCTDAEWHREMRSPAREGLHRRHIEVIVMIVRDDDEIDIRQFPDRNGGRMKTFRTDQR